MANKNTMELRLLEGKPLSDFEDMEKNCVDFNLKGNKTDYVNKCCSEINIDAVSGEMNDVEEVGKGLKQVDEIKFNLNEGILSPKKIYNNNNNVLLEVPDSLKEEGGLEESFDSCGNKTVIFRGNTGDDYSLKEGEVVHFSGGVEEITKDIMTQDEEDGSKLDDSVGNCNDISRIQRTPGMVRFRRRLSGSVGKTPSRGRLVTSTPFTNRHKQQDTSATVGASYTTPAQLVLDNWKPLYLKDNNKSCNSSLSNIAGDTLGDISEIKNVIGDDSVMKTPKRSESHKSGENGFEEKFQGLYTTLFGDKEAADTNTSPHTAYNKSLNMLETYHNSIVEQHKQDNMMFDEILSQMPSNHKMIVIDEYVATGMNDLSTIIEESSTERGDSQGNETEICGFGDKTLVPDGGDEVGDKLKENTVLEEILQISKKEVVEEEGSNVPNLKKKGSLSITYRSQKELTLDDEAAVLVSDDDDAVSLQCSEISLTPRSVDSVTIKLEQDAELTPKAVDNVVVKLEEQAVVDAELVPKSVKLEPVNDADCKVPVVEKVDAEGVVEMPMPPDKVFKVEVESVKLEPLMSLDVQMPSNAAATIRSSDIFISSDPKENADNDDPDWELLKRLNNDQDRYKALRERWRSVVIPNPNIDLTCQNYRNRHLLATESEQLESGPSYASVPVGNTDFKRNLKRPVPWNDNPVLSKRRKCVSYFEDTIEEVLKKFEFKRYCLQNELNMRLNTLARRQELDKHRMYLYNYNNAFDIWANLQRMHSNQVNEIRMGYSKAIENAQNETAEYVKILNVAADEIYSFYQFYDNLDSTSEDRCSLYLTEEQFRDVVQVEHTLDLYEKFYQC